MPSKMQQHCKGDSSAAQTQTWGSFWVIIHTAKSWFSDLENKHPEGCLFASYFFKYISFCFHPHKHNWPWAGREMFVLAAQPACGGTEPKQTFRMLRSLSLPSSSHFLNVEHLCSVNPFCIFLHSGFRPADPAQGSHVGNSQPWDVPSDQPEPSRVRTGVPARTHTL